MSKSSEMKYKRIVVKLGTRLLTDSKPNLDLAVMANLVTQVAQLHQNGAEIIIASSGAIAAGRHKLGITRSLKGIPLKQILASVGQSRLMNTYEKLFDHYSITVAQALLTKADLTDRAGYLNARNTLTGLLELGVVCIVNENDIISIDEIKEAKFGDNDVLSAMVANLVDADLLVILTDTDGLFTADPYHDPKAELIPEVRKIDSKIVRLGRLNTDDIGTGGMITKIEAARLATSSGITVVFANGQVEDVIIRLAAGEAIGTRFLPSTTRMESRKRWLLSGLSTKGKLIIDNGAAAALKNQNRSLLSAGIDRAEGKFSRGEIVAIHDLEDNHLGCGVTNYSSEDIGIIKGAHSSKIATLLSVDYGPEVVHRNNLALLEGKETSGDRKTIPIN
jgi:glutamate 5-kinase